MEKKKAMDDEKSDDERCEDWEENENEILGPKEGNERGSTGLKDFQIHISSMETICIHRMGRENDLYGRDDE